MYNDITGGDAYREFLSQQETFKQINFSSMTSKTGFDACHCDVIIRGLSE